MEDMEITKRQLDWYEDTLTRLTSSPKPEYEVLASDEEETVVWVANAPSDYHGRGIFLFRMALEFPEADHVTFWLDADAAKEYAAERRTIEDDHQPYLLGRIRYQENQWILEQFGSTSGPSPIQFGKFADSPSAAKPRTITNAGELGPGP